MSLVLIAAALLPAIVLLVYVYHKDTVEKEPIGLIARVFVLGALAGPLAAIVENILFNVFDALIPAGVLLLIVQYFIGVAAVEEGFKYLALLTVRRHPEFNYVFDGIVYAVAAALGFAALENVLYVLDGGLEVALTRAIFSVPGHCADGVVMGCFFGLAYQREMAGNKAGARSFYWLAFLLPVIEHGFYDAALSSDNDLMILAALVVEVSFVIFAMILVNRISKTDSRIVAAPASQSGAVPLSPQQPTVQQPMVQQPTGQQPIGQQPSSQQPLSQQPYQPQAQVAAAPVAGSWTCPRCGHVNAGKFCGECGARRP